MQGEIEDSGLGPIFVVGAIAARAEEAIVLLGAVERDADDGGGAGAAVVGGRGDFDRGGRGLGGGDGRGEVFVEVAAGGGRWKSGWGAVIEEA